VGGGRGGKAESTVTVLGMGGGGRCKQAVKKLAGDALSDEEGKERQIGKGEGKGETKDFDVQTNEKNENPAKGERGTKKGR